MPRRKITFDTVRELGLALPGVEAATSWGAPALKVRKKMFACTPTHRSAEPDSLVVRIDFDLRDRLITAAPQTYYLKPHYVNYPCVLVRFKHISRADLRELLETSWRYVSTRSKRPARRR
jgi:hypothetical protein